MQLAFDQIQPGITETYLLNSSLDEFVGQEHFLGPGKLLRRMLEADRLTSVIFYGPPGTGKTTLASLIAAYTKSHFESVNAAAVGVKEVRQILDAAKERLANSGLRTVLFLDEIHRFNRAQQDILLPDVEAGLVLLVGATTENPFFAVNSPLISRSQIFQFSPISEDDIRKLIADECNNEVHFLLSLPIVTDRIRYGVRSKNCFQSCYYLIRCGFAGYSGFTRSGFLCGHRTSLLVPTPISGSTVSAVRESALSASVRKLSSLVIDRSNC